MSETTSLAVFSAKQSLEEYNSQEKLDLILKTLAPEGTTQLEFELAVEICKKRGLSILSRQAFIVKRYDSTKKTKVATLQVSIDGFRLIAERSGQYAGQIGPFWCGPDGKWVDVWLSPTNPVAAKIAVLRKDFTEPLWATALFESYCAKDSNGNPMALWKTQGPLMIAKCAEMLALRRAFPEGLSGVYGQEEMDKDTTETTYQTVDPNQTTPKNQEPNVSTQPDISEEEELKRQDMIVAIEDWVSVNGTNSFSEAQKEWFKNIKNKSLKSLTTAWATIQAL